MTGIGIRILNNTVIVNFLDIKRIEANSNYCHIYFNDGKKLVVAKVLCWFQNKLPADIFMRVHRSHLVNRHHVKNVDTTTLHMNSGESIAISRRKKTANKKALQLFGETPYSFN